MKRSNRPQAIAATPGGASLHWLALLALAAALALSATPVHAQVTPPARTAPSSPGNVPSPGSAGPSVIAPPSGGAGVVQPPGNVDPGITKTPPPAAAFPTPVVRPPATTNNGRTVVVPK